MLLRICHACIVGMPSPDREGLNLPDARSGSDSEALDTQIQVDESSVDSEVGARYHSLNLLMIFLGLFTGE